MVTLRRGGRGGGGGRFRGRLSFCRVHRSRHRNVMACGRRRERARERERDREESEEGQTGDLATRALVAAGVIAVGAGSRLAAGVRAARVLHPGAAVDARARPPAPVRFRRVRPQKVRIRFKHRAVRGFGGRVFRAPTFRRRVLIP